MSRRRFLHGVGAASLASLAVACTPKPASPPARIGYVRSAANDPEDTLGNLRQGLRDFGYVEGQNLLIEYRFADGNEERLPTLLQELIDQNVALIVLGDTRPIPIARQLTQTVPLVMMFSTDPVGLGLVESMARPGGNLTGLSAFNEQLAGKRLDVLREVAPGIKTVALLHSPSRAMGARELAAVQQAADLFRIALVTLRVESLGQLDVVLSEPVPARVDALYVLPDVLFWPRVQQIVDFAAQHRLPAVYATRAYVEAGGLMMYDIDRPALARRAGYYVDRILKGTRPADLPIEQPTRFEWVLNMKTARALELTIPAEVLQNVTSVID